ncbi:MAG: hypothetical protein L0216_19430 [Planctomycetales bacterium]|nr:hypothetical protein [Planctomycetales bacterium]
MDGIRPPEPVPLDETERTLESRKREATQRRDRINVSLTGSPRTWMGRNSSVGA